MNILFLGDVFGEPGIQALEKKLKKIIKSNKIDFVVAQAENASGRKGLVPADYHRMMEAGVNAFTLGNHVWAKKEIEEIIDNDNVIRPYNVAKKYSGHGTMVFDVKGKKVRVTQLMGQAFNELRNPWREKFATNFFDAFDSIPNDADFHLVDFHGETTSEKNVFGIYIDGKASLVGTHTHIQTNDARILPKGSAYITDAGMVGPINSAIGADWDSVYQKMRFDRNSRFTVSTNEVEINGVIITVGKTKNTIKTLNETV